MEHIDLIMFVHQHVSGTQSEREHAAWFMVEAFLKEGSKCSVLSDA